MSRLTIKSAGRAEKTIEQLYEDLARRIAGSPPGICPVDLALSFLDLCKAQSCGKCVPCRVGLQQLSALLQQVLDGECGEDVLDTIEETAKVIIDTADCAIGVGGAQMVLDGLNGFRDDYEAHIRSHRCLGRFSAPVPCVQRCPAGVDIPGYIALVKEGRCADAVRLIRKDNPFPSACAYICEHPCEERCRRKLLDDAINIRGLKRYAVDQGGDVPQPKCAEPTGKTVAVVGGGPGGLSAAYYLSLMGHKVTVYEKRKQLGGMMRYGIPSYRFPREILDREINSILSLGIEVKLGVDAGTDISFADLKKQYDAIYLCIGAHIDKKARIPGEDSEGVMSAVDMLRRIGDNDLPDFTGMKVAVVGGGNVAMDVTRSAVRLGADKVTCVYRRRQEDMPAQAEEVEGAIAEGAEILALHAPVRVETDENGRAVALWAQPQLPGPCAQGRPKPVAANVPEVRIPADLIVMAIGQGIDSHGLTEDTGVQVKRGGTLLADNTTRVPDLDGVFAGGDCVSGPVTVIRAIEGGKVAAANIDEYLGFHHEISVDVDIPAPKMSDLSARGRINLMFRPAAERRNDFSCIECGMTGQESTMEASRCMRCDHYGYGSLRGGRVEKW